MRVDKFSQIILDDQDIIDMIMSQPDQQIRAAFVEPTVRTDTAPYAELEIDSVPEFLEYSEPPIDLAEFDTLNQNDWHMPPEYYALDVAELVLGRCKHEAELQRCALELIEFERRQMMPLLRYLAYLCDTMRDNNIVWGVGRGSSVASYVLYKLGVHKIDSLYYDLDITEFLKPLAATE